MNPRILYSEEISFDYTQDWTSLDNIYLQCQRLGEHMATWLERTHPEYRAMTIGDVIMVDANNHPMKCYVFNNSPQPVFMEVEGTGWHELSQGVVSGWLRMKSSDRIMGYVWCKNAGLI